MPDHVQPIRARATIAVLAEDASEVADTLRRRLGADRGTIHGYRVSIRDNRRTVVLERLALPAAGDTGSAAAAARIARDLDLALEVLPYRYTGLVRVTAERVRTPVLNRTSSPAGDGQPTPAAGA